MTRPLLLLTWRDHYTTGGWKTADEYTQEPDINRTVGWLVAEDDERVTIVQTVGTEFMRDSMTLEKSCLLKRRVLR